MCICEFIEFLFVSIFIETFGLGVAKNVDVLLSLNLQCNQLIINPGISEIYIINTENAPSCESNKLQILKQLYD